MINGSTILYVDPNKNKTNNWLSVNRLQLPLRSSQFGLISKITYNNGVVNVVPTNETDNNIQFSFKDSNGRKLSEGQQEYFKDSKARDEDGRLLVGYHGTSQGGFSAFDISREKPGFFTTSKRDADSYGGMELN